MAEEHDLLKEEELEFLLQEKLADDGGAKANQLPGDGEVTMRGDLDKIELADIFQTLAMSKMEGQLRVRNLIEQHELFFRDGYVQSIPPQRIEIKRIGQRLLSAGLVTIEQLRAALLVQKKNSERQLGTILVEEQYVSEEDIEDIFANQVQEDLFALFTWKNGSFEFYRGTCNDAETIARLEATPSFEVNGLLLEVARRGDEWERVTEAIGDLDEILELDPDVAPEEPFEGDYETVISSIDGIRTVRSVADHSGLSLFSAGCVVRDLVNGGFLRPIPTLRGIEVAEKQFEEEKPKNALLTFHVMRRRDEALEIELGSRIAKGLARCGDSRNAARVLVAAGQHSEDPAAALSAARLARRISPRSSETLRFLQRQLRAQDDDLVRDELIDVTSDLADACTEEGETEEALAAVRELERLAPGNPNALNRRARILAKFSYVQEAISALEELLAIFVEESDVERQKGACEQILKLDPTRRDIAKTLKALRTGKATIRIRRFAIAAAVAAVSCYGYYEYLAFVDHAKLVQIKEEALADVEAGDPHRARARIASAMESNPETTIFAPVLARLKGMEDQIRAEERERRETVLAETFEKADLAIAEGNIETALGIYDTLLKLGKTQKEVAEIVKLRIETVHTKIEAMRSALTIRVPPRPNLLQSQADRERIVASARENFRDVELRLATAVLSPVVREQIDKHLDPGARDALFEAAEQICNLFSESRTIVAAHEAELDRTRTAQRLTPLFDAARRHEDKYEFDKALDAYRRLSRDHPEDDEIKAGFQERVERYATITRLMQALSSATERGNFAAAQGQLRALQQSYPDIPFAQLVQLPVRVTTTPPGASITIEGKPVGESPVVGAYHPGNDVVVRIDLDGFHVEESRFTGDEVSTVQSLLAKKASWTVEIEAAVDVMPVVDRNGLAFFADRAGRVTCIDLTAHKVLWRFDTKDMSGLLPTPTLVAPDAVAVASIDGTVRCFGRSDGELRWSQKDLPTDVAPVSVGQRVVIATADERLVGLDAKTGEQRFEFPSGGTLAAGLVEIDTRRFVAISTSGRATTIDALKGRIHWSVELGDGVLVRPCLAGSLLGVQTANGVLLGVSTRDGQIAWRSNGAIGLDLPLSTDGQMFYLATDAGIDRFHVRTGRRAESYTTDGRVSAPPASFGGDLFVGREDGACEVIDARTLEPRYLLRGPGRISVPALAWGPRRGVVLTIANGTIMGFADVTRPSDAARPPDGR